MRSGLLAKSTARPAFTLIELLVTIAILLLLMTIGVAFLPTLGEDLKVVNATDLLVTKFLTAKQRAKRDGKPTGLRLLINNDQYTGTYNCSDLVYIQQPDDLNTGNFCIGGIAAGANQVWFEPGTDFYGGLGLYGSQADYAPVMAGDYFEIRRSGGVALITGVSPPPNPPGSILPAYLVLHSPMTGGTPIAGPNVGGFPSAGPNATKDWRVIRSPRRLQGEETVSLPTNIDILIWVPPQSSKYPYSLLRSQYNLPGGPSIQDPNNPTQSTQWIQVSQNVPQTHVVMSGLVPTFPIYCDILFSPSGSVVGQGTGADKIILWIDDKTGAVPPALLVINVRTGLIGVHPALMLPAFNDPFASTKTGRSSGM